MAAGAQRMRAGVGFSELPESREAGAGVTAIATGDVRAEMQPHNWTGVLPVLSCQAVALYDRVCA